MATLLLVGACQGSTGSVSGPAQILVEFKQRPDEATLQSLAAKHGLTLTRMLPSSGIALFAISGQRDAASLIEQIKHDPAVSNAELDQPMSVKESP